ncbi:hypothetical protein PIOMA14_II_0429 [Prevotella intermedia]|uniref:Uncharacterized protein n=1 Tax=Prevotella intermedia TaxID=28131 RepID=A0A0S3UN55_PREIN|nr:hypothetical protein PIOMA14_II_0429 [Prevotella intermedia]
MQKSRFYRAKPTLSERKTIGFVKCWCIGGYAIVTGVKNVYSVLSDTCAFQAVWVRCLE